MVETLRLKAKEQKGFTLIELLAVIVILGIIAAIAIPAIGNVISKSNTKADAQAKIQVINAAKMFVTNSESNDDDEITKTELENAGYLDHVDSSLGENFYVTVENTNDKKGYYYHSDSSDSDGTSENELIGLAK